MNSFPITIDLVTGLILGLFLIGLIILVVLFRYLKRHFYYKNVVIPRTLDWVFLEIQVPKQNDENARGGEEQWKQQVAVAEQLYATLSDLGKMAGVVWKSRDYISLEIACLDKKISFYINCTRKLQELVEKQVQAQYPHAYIEASAGYNPFAEGSKLEAVELQLNKSYIYPVRTYKSMETDPLNAITNAMSKLSEGEGIVVQLLISPAGKDWQKRPRKVAGEIQSGKDPDKLENPDSLLKSLVKEAKKSVSSKDETPEKPQGPLTPMQQDIVKRLEEKASRPGFKTNLRLITSSTVPGSAKILLDNLLSSFLQYSMPPFNGFKLRKAKDSDIAKDFIFRVFHDRGESSVLNTEELASLWHLPTPALETPNINWLASKRAPAPVNIPKEGLRLGTNVYRGVETPIFMTRSDRRRHLYILGRTGGGKSTLIANLAVQDITNGEGLCIVDPHGDLVNDVLDRMPASRADDVILFEPFDTDRPLGLNMLEVDREEQKDFAVQEMIGIFYKLVTDPAMLGPMFEHNMRNAMLTLMADEEYPGTITDIPRIFTDTKYQEYKVSKVKDLVVREFWEKEMAKTSDHHKSEMLGYLVSKVGRFVENSMMRNIVGQPKSSFNFRKIMDEGKILLVNLAKGRTGEINAKLIGLILVSKIQMAALSRADIPEDDRRDFYLYVDEFQNFITDAFASILSEARKYKLNLIIAHQYLAQLSQGAGAQGAGSSDLRDAVFGNAGSILTYRTGAEDAEFLQKEFSPTFNAFDLVNIEMYNTYIKLLINGSASRPFNMRMAPLPPNPNRELAEKIRQLSRLKHGRPRAEVERDIFASSTIADLMAAGQVNTDNLFQ